MSILPNELGFPGEIRVSAFPRCPPKKPIEAQMGGKSRCPTLSTTALWRLGRRLLGAVRRLQQPAYESLVGRIAAPYGSLPHPPPPENCLVPRVGVVVAQHRRALQPQQLPLRRVGRCRRSTHHLRLHQRVSFHPSLTIYTGAGLKTTALAPRDGLPVLSSLSLSVHPWPLTDHWPLPDKSLAAA